jgi:hypothetical protein
VVVEVLVALERIQKAQEQEGVGDSMVVAAVAADAKAR